MSKERSTDFYWASGLRAGRYRARTKFSMIRERQLLDYAMTQRRNDEELRKTLRRLGFTAAELKDYKRMIRFVPKYVETYI